MAKDKKTLAGLTKMLKETKAAKYSSSYNSPNGGKNVFIAIISQEASSMLL
ncbi:hypothetical protein [Wolbachia endosymbiont (group B) of Sphaerophoria taeniata]|uniref:hypothetical protein n=1 Tax=Wolbachia endosymbiont (group B) of Sphaerophoria taeniata TaxID=2954058 RepID=UPI00221F0881|nr:hypothetical protein [Wolbachia endosymbiont (group B) of Sphaerophoria taeniata]